MVLSLERQCCGAAGARHLCVRAHKGVLRAQRFFGTAVGKGRQAAKTEIERLKLGELSCEQGINEVAKMCASVWPCLPAACTGASDLSRSPDRSE